MSREPFQDRCADPAELGYFTTPCCFAELRGRATELNRCPACGGAVHCHVEQRAYNVCKLAEPEADEQDEAA